MRQIGAGYQSPSMVVLEDRMHRLENMVAALTEALSVLAHGLEGGPLAEPGDKPVADAARQAREILLSMRS